ncbi:MAG: hypothetical protein H0T54_04285 [Geodermatophilaceae bacterium]|nr:hypothetical protein [Geodermatophilaceae bacterium]
MSTAPVSRWRAGLRRWLVRYLLTLGLVASLIFGLLAGFTHQVAGHAWLDPADAAEHEIGDAAITLAVSAGQRFTGSFSSDAGQRVGMQAQVSNEGSMVATLRLAGEEVQFVATGQRRFVQASQHVWSSLAVPAADAALYDRKWVQVDSDFLGVDLPTLLAPQRLAWVIADPARLQTTSDPGDVEDVNGVPARPTRAGNLTVWLSQDEPQRIVRLRSDSGQHGGDLVGQPPALGPGSDKDDQDPDGDADEPDGGLAPGLPNLALDLIEIAAQQAQQLLERTIADAVRQLAESIDARVSFTLNGQIVLAPCGASGCTATVFLTNTVTSNSPYVMLNQPVNAQVTTTMTLDGVPVGSCTTTVVMPPNGSASTTCPASYVVPPSQNPRIYTVRAEAIATARALLQTDIDAMIAELTVERGRSRTYLYPSVPGSRPGQPPGLPSHEGRDLGHTMKSHVGWSDQQLLGRMQNNAPPQAASSYPNLAVADQVVGATIARNATQIRQWLDDPNGEAVLPLTYTGTTATGRYIEQGSTTVKDVTGATVRLLRSQSGPGAGLGYFILSSFPSP